MVAAMCQALAHSPAGVILEESQVLEMPHERKATTASTLAAMGLSREDVVMIIEQPTQSSKVQVETRLPILIILLQMLCCNLIPEVHIRVSYQNGIILGTIPLAYLCCGPQWISLPMDWWISCM